MSVFAGVCCAILCLVAGTTAGLRAQYPIMNNSPVMVCVCIHTANCGIVGPYCVAAGAQVIVPIPLTCDVAGIQFTTEVITVCEEPGPFYPIGFNGGLPPPNPPGFLQLSPVDASFW